MNSIKGALAGAAGVVVVGGVFAARRRGCRTEPDPRWHVLTVYEPLGGVRPGDVVAVWGAGAVGQMAARASMLLGVRSVFTP